MVVVDPSYYVTDVKVPGMLHGRMIRSPIAGAVPVRVEEASIKDFPGAKVVWQKGVLGVVAAEGRDHAVPDGEGLDEAGGMSRGTDLPVGQDQVSLGIRQLRHRLFRRSVL